MPKMPDEMDGTRYIEKYRGEDIYVIVAECEHTGLPLEVFVRFDQEGMPGQEDTKWLTEAGWDVITRLLSKMLQSQDEEFTLRFIIKQIGKCKRIKNDLPTILERVLSNYLDREQVDAKTTDHHPV